MVATLTLGEVMTPSPKTISPHARLSDAAALMEELGINHLPIVDNGVVESIITDRDIKRFTLPAHKLADEEDLLTSDVGSTRAIVADIHDPLPDVLRHMVAQNSEAVAVLDQGELVGIFTESDACRVLADLLSI